MQVTVVELGCPNPDDPQGDQHCQPVQTRFVVGIRKQNNGGGAVPETHQNVGTKTPSPKVAERLLPSSNSEHIKPIFGFLSEFSTCIYSTGKSYSDFFLKMNLLDVFWRTPNLSLKFLSLQQMVEWKFTQMKWPLQSWKWLTWTWATARSAMFMKLDCNRDAIFVFREI